jgi:hypothetical protein
MSTHYGHYAWKEGIPIGLGSVDPSSTHESYKVIADPYRKRISLEKYHYQQFDKVVYDSALINFKDFKRSETLAWQKTMEKDDKGISRGFIRNQEDRLIFIETYRFQEDLCRECRVHSPHSFLLSIHEMYYSHLGDFFDGVILYDSNHHPVMFKRYVFDAESRQFTDLIEEQWDMEKFPLPSGSLK